MKSAFCARFFVAGDAEEEEILFTIVLETFDASMVKQRLSEEMQSTAQERFIVPFHRAVDTLEFKEGAFNPSEAYVVMLKFGRKTIVKLVFKEHEKEKDKRVIEASVSGITDQPPSQGSLFSMILSFLLCALLVLVPLVPLYFGSLNG